MDFVGGFWGGYVKDYLDASEPYFAVGEYWDSLSYTYNEMDHNQDAHRQRIIDWINATNGTAGAFDVTTKGILHSALERREYWRLSYQKGKPSGVVGWWPIHAVTFIENHDTGSTQAERDVYAAIIDEKVAMKIRPSYYEPPSGPQRWRRHRHEVHQATPRDHSNGAPGCNNQQPQGDQPTATTVKRSSRFRGVSRHRWTGRFEAHLWDKASWNPTQRKKGKQGAYDEEESAARVYDLAAIKYWGISTFTNFPISDYQKEVEMMRSVTKEEYLASLRRRSCGFSRGVSRYRGVARHHHSGRWEARIGRVFGNKYLYLGTQEEAAHAYDIAAIEYRGINAVTNFDLSTYIRWLKPGANDALVSDQIKTTSASKLPAPASNFFLTEQPLFNTNALIAEPIDIRKKAVVSHCPNSSSAPSTALSLLLRSSKFNKLVEQNLNANYDKNKENGTKGMAEVEVENVPITCSGNRSVLSGLESGESKLSLYDERGQSMWNGALNLLT
ncbi:Ethylene-responsive transcription factor WRI1 [Hibiscus syriacus]|uniref:Ethylene-responsive transcription factor WRI1 n=1 Tax=Hibiscus syriacus TaxID=106335 RepID=A0A6A2XFW1_HIBSY|nr:Ethylene-responsive transcription factor WRI1 [Hibiscus syriacus]